MFLTWAGTSDVTRCPGGGGVGGGGVGGGVGGGGVGGGGTKGASGDGGGNRDEDRKGGSFMASPMLKCVQTNYSALERVHQQIVPVLLQAGSRLITTEHCAMC
jgi:hypothetical protein